MKVYFKNKESIEITQEIAKIIRNKVLEGAKNFQCFSNENDEVLLIINITEITYIL